MEKRIAYAWVIEKNLFEQHEALFNNIKYHNEYIITEHGEDCDRAKHKGAHMHIVVWPTAGKQLYSDTRIVRKFRAMDPHRENWDYQRVKNLSSILLYITHKEKTLHSKCVSPETEYYIDNLPKEAIQRMDKYVTKRDAAKITLSSLVQLMYKYRAHNLSYLLNILAKRSHEDPAILDQLTNISGHPRIQQLERQANDLVKKRNAAVPYNVHLQEFEDNYDPEEYCTVESTKGWIKSILLYNNIDYEMVCNEISKLLLKKVGKKNCLWIYGQSNAGKSVFTRSIVDAVPTHGQLLQSADFMFQDCQDVPLIYSEETQITSDIVSDFKKVMEGTMIHANKKYKDTYELYRTPMICCSNERPDEHCRSESEALYNRTIFMQFKPYPRLKELHKRLNPLFWKHRIARVLAGEKGGD